MVPTIQDQEGRDALMEMARVWLRLAETYQDDSSILSDATKEPRPVMQQQQQVPPQKDDDKDLVAAFASQASAQNTAGRDAAIGR